MYKLQCPAKTGLCDSQARNAPANSFKKLSAVMWQLAVGAPLSEFEAIAGRLSIIVVVFGPQEVTAR
jgi:hypothetical protein